MEPYSVESEKHFSSAYLVDQSAKKLLFYSVPDFNKINIIFSNCNKNFLDNLLFGLEV